ncbi:DUF1810 family protein [Mesorhizobium intechi]|uniref:DUF1810 domain-containing protein n=1 Tax=Mesorhizobium intechi TaxID=537601 RepID=UPI000CBA73A2|nr:DUF1810 family protein [Mesorhizobium intechi]TSE07862.1 DUF1810 family protein [Mesorhizobium intechi]
MNDEYDLQRFIAAQDPVYDDALGILRQGMMWTPYLKIIFPRLRARRSNTATDPYAIASLDEARAYLSSPILGGRYRECIGVLQRLSGWGAGAIFGDHDSKKLHASLTLFSEASNDEFLLQTMFDVWFDGLLDEDTMNELNLGS